MLLVAGGAPISIYAQNRPKSPQKPVAKPSQPRMATTKQPGPLKAGDYRYYVLVQRGQSQVSDAIKTQYSLGSSRSYLTDARFNFDGQWIVMDIRTGKEVAWWPASECNYYSATDKQLYSFARERKILIGFDETGVPGYSEIMSTQYGSPFGAVHIFLSNDLRKGAFTFNKDIWALDFDPKRGKFGEPVQVTFNGVMPREHLYLKDNIIIAESAGFGDPASVIIDLKTGRFTPVKDYSSYQNPYIQSTLFYGGQYAPSGFIDIRTRQPIKKYDNGIILLGWVDKKCTRAILKRYSTDAEKNTHGPWRHLIVSTESGRETALDIPGGFLEDGNDQTIYDHRFSPGRHQLVHLNQGQLYIYALDLDCKPVAYPVTLQPGMLGEERKRICWTDESHLLLNLNPGDILKGDEITTASQGTWIFDLKTRNAVRVTAYYTDLRNKAYTNAHPNAVTPPQAGYTAFTANGYLFRCKPDGSEVTQLTKIPGLYDLKRVFLDFNLDLE